MNEGVANVMLVAKIDNILSLVKASAATAMTACHRSPCMLIAKLFVVENLREEVAIR